MKIEEILEKVVFKSRWILAPMYLGLVGGLLCLFVMTVVDTPEREIVLSILALVDMTLVANLLIMVIFSGYENFVSKIDVDNHEDKPHWMGKVDYSGLKLKLIGSIVAISAIDLLKAFMHASTPGQILTNTQMAWMVGIHLTFIVSGVLFAIMDKIAEDTPHH
jgi:uncharacterized protein (TIGR00645 family)